MTFAQVTLAQWRAQVEQELKGQPFDKVLVSPTPEGVSVQPLYVERPKGQALEAGAGHFRVALEGGDAAAVRADLEGGSDAVWVSPGLRGIELGDAWLLLEPGTLDAKAALAEAKRLGAKRFHLGLDAQAKGVTSLVVAPGNTSVTVSTLPFHRAGADGADELALALSLGVAALRDGLAPRALGFRIAVGRDTFVELCKLRALRLCWRKVLTASGLGHTPRTFVHAVTSTRTITQRDPWVNLLRATTQTFAAVLGGADVVTPLPFDAALAERSAHARRVARNTALVLREESALGQVVDPAAGAYFFETLTDGLAREAWKRFQALEAEGGARTLVASGEISARLERGWQSRLQSLAKRKSPLLGTSEFANPDETLPSAPIADPGLGHRDSEAFEALRRENDGTQREVVLYTLGNLAESRARVGFATGLFGAGGYRVRETTQAEGAPVVCVCGSDERYATEAVPAVKALKAAGAGTVLLAGRPGALEAELSAAGSSGAIFMGVDVLDVLQGLSEAWR